MKKYRVLKREGKFYPQKTFFFDLLWGFYSYKGIAIVDNINFDNLESAKNYIADKKEFDEIQTYEA